jgi:hypothetical protein
MKRYCILAVLGPIAAAISALIAASTPGYTADPHEVSKDIIAVQIRKQGFKCETPQSAERDPTSGNPDDQLWILKCEDASYRVHLIPDMGAEVEKLADEKQNAQ